MSAQEIGLGFLICVTGVTLACLYGRRSNGFRWSKYFALLFAPTLVVGLMAFTFDTKILWLYQLALFLVLRSSLG